MGLEGQFQLMSGLSFIVKWAFGFLSIIRLHFVRARQPTLIKNFKLFYGAIVCFLVLLFITLNAYVMYSF